jgi:D-glycero-D-manno-heptose 1,7-bisphosphate phosphatase
MAHRAVFLDRDGVLVIPKFGDGRSYAPRTLEEFAIYPDAAECVTRMKNAGYKVIVVTNQPDVGAGFVARDVVESMHRRLLREMPLDAIKTCYHAKDQSCACRKPQPGLLIEAAEDMRVDLKKSVMVGDRASDVDAGFRAGCRTAFIDLGYTAEAKPAHADCFAASLAAATDWVLSLAS